MFRKMLWFLVIILLIGLAAWGPIVSNVEQAKYEVVELQGKIEIRDYAPMIVAQAQVSGERKQAINKGFRIIAIYGSGCCFVDNTLI